MKVLTVSSSPYLLTKLGRMNSSILCYLNKNGYEVGSAVFHNDPAWFVPGNDGIVKFEKNNQFICNLYPFLNLAEKSSVQVYEIMKKFQPDIVITMGDYQEVDFLFAIKALHPNLFKWINILTIDAYPINNSRKDAFKYMDYVLTTTKLGLTEVTRLTSVAVEHLPFGVDSNVFYDTGVGRLEDRLDVFGCGKNSQTSNPAAFIKGLLDANKIEKDINGYLHTNISDLGDYDLFNLRDRYRKGCLGNVEFPTLFVGLNDGVNDSELNYKYNTSDVIVDVSVRSSTALSLLEGMSTGCIPVGTRVGAIKEVISMMPKEYQFFVRSNTYVSNLDEEYEIVSSEDLSSILLKIYQLKKKDLNKFGVIREISRSVAKKFDVNGFLVKIKDIIEKTKNLKKNLVVEIMS
jgi:glycosyltransferase involved in cell wall biosynthesis